MWGLNPLLGSGPAIPDFYSNSEVFCKSVRLWVFWKFSWVRILCTCHIDPQNTQFEYQRSVYLSGGHKRIQVTQLHCNKDQHILYVDSFVDSMTSFQILWAAIIAPSTLSSLEFNRRFNSPDWCTDPSFPLFSSVCRGSYWKKVDSWRLNSRRSLSEQSCW